MIFLKRQAVRALAIDIGSSAIKMLVTEGTYAGGMSVLDYRMIQTNAGGKPMAVDELPAVLRQTLEAMRASTTEVRTVVSGRQVIVRIIEMPKSSREELKKAVAFQLSRYVPVNPDEAMFDCAPLESEQAREGWQKCLLAATRKAVVEEHLTSLRGAGLMPLLIEPEPTAVMNAFVAAGNDFDRSEGIPPVETGGVGLVHFGMSHTELCLLRGRVPVACRSIEAGDGEIIRELVTARKIDYPEAIRIACGDIEKHDDLRRITRKMLAAIAAETSTLFDYCKREFDLRPERLYVTGGLADKPSTAPLMQELTGVPTYRFNPFVRVKLDALEGRLGDFQSQTSAFVPVLGCAARQLSLA